MTTTATEGHPGISRWIRRMLAGDPPRAQSLIVTVWGDLLAPHGGEIWLSSLFRLLAPLGLNERLVRTSVFRLARDGGLTAQPIGRRTRYRLTAAGAHRFALAYRRIYTPPERAWDGRWEVALMPERLDAAVRRSLRDDLGWEGFAEVAPGMHARPARESARAVRVAVENPAHEKLTMFEARDVDGAAGGALASRVERGYGLDALAGEYRRFLARFSGVVDACRNASQLDAEQAFVVRSLLVHEYRRVRLRDPQLPQALLPAHWPGAAAYTVCHELYRQLLPASETHLSNVLAADGDRLLPALPEFLTRFREAKPAGRA